MKLMDCIKRIPSALENIAQYYQAEQPLFEALKKENFEKVHVIGSGTSYNAALIAKYFAENELGIHCHTHYPNLFLNDTNFDLFSSKDLFVFVSQGGKTKLVFDGVKKAKDLGYKTLALTENLEGPIAKEADYSLDMMSDQEEFIFRTIGYDASCVNLILLFSTLFDKGDKTEAFLEDLKKVGENIPAIIEKTTGWYEAYGSAYRNLQSYLFVGNGILYPVAQEANIKFMEMIPKVTFYFELEESIHGPQNCFTDQIGYFFINHGWQRETNDKITDFIRKEVSKNVVTITNRDAEGSFNIEPVGKYFYFLEYITFFQVLAYHLATANNRDLSTGVYPQVSEYINKSL